MPPGMGLGKCCCDDDEEPTGSCTLAPFWAPWPYTKATGTIDSSHLNIPSSCDLAEDVPCIALSNMVLPYAPGLPIDALLKSYVFDVPMMNPILPLVAPAYRASNPPANASNAYMGADYSVVVYCPIVPVALFPDVEVGEGFFTLVNMLWSGNCLDSFDGDKYTRNFIYSGTWLGWSPTWEAMAEGVACIPFPLNGGNCESGTVLITFE